MKLKRKVKKYVGGGNNTLPVDNTRVDKIYIDKSKSKKTYQSPFSKDKQEWINKSTGRIEESMSPLDLIPIGAVNTSSKFINNAFKFYSNYNKAADVVNGYELYNDLDKLPGKKENMNIYRDGGFNSLPQIFADGGISRFEVPVQQAQGLSPFQLPYNEIATALLSKQKSYDEKEAEMAKNQAFLADLKSGYRTAGLPQEIQKEYNDKFQSYVGQDLNKPEIKRAFVGDIARLKSDPRLRTLAADIKQSALWDNYQQAHPDLAGAAVNPYNVNGQWTPAKDAQGNWQGEDQVNNWYGNITPYSDFNKPIDDAYGKVKANVVQSLTDSGIQVQHDETTGKDFFYKDITKKDKQYIDETLPQWQAAATEQSINFQSSSTPEARYFQARFAKEIAQDPDFIKKYISTAGGKYVYNQVKTEDISKQVGSSSGSGNGTKKEEGSVQPFGITQISKSNPNLRGFVLPQDEIQRIGTSIEAFKKENQKYGQPVRDNEGNLIFQVPSGATVDVVNEIDAKNAQFKELQREQNNLKDINAIVASKHGFAPNLTGEYDVRSQLPAGIAKEAKEAYDRFSQSQYDPVSGGYIQPNPQEAIDAFNTIAKKDPKFKAYMDDLNAISEGITLSKENAYPLVDEKYKDVNAGVLNLLTTTTNYFDGKKGEIEYLQNNNKISDDDKKYVSDLLAEKGLGALTGHTSLFWDKEKGEYSILASFPKPGGKDNIHLKISQDLMGGIPTEALKVDPAYHDAELQKFRKAYEDHSQKTNNGHGLITGVKNDIETTHVMTPEKDINGIELNPGETVFTLPSLPNIVVKVGTLNNLDDFIKDYEANAPQGVDLLNTLKTHGMQPITSPGLYKRYKRDLKPGSLSPK